MTKHKVQTPGAALPPVVADETDPNFETDLTVEEQLAKALAENERLRTLHEAHDAKVVEAPEAQDADVYAELGRLRAENTALKEAEAAAAKVPQPVFEPITPHGKVRMEESACRNITSTELMRLIDTGQAEELPFGQNMLCLDGYYTSRGKENAKG